MLCTVPASENSISYPVFMNKIEIVVFPVHCTGTVYIYIYICTVSSVYRVLGEFTHIIM